MADYSTDLIPYLKPPRNVTELKSLLSICNVYPQFVPNFARMAAPFNKNLKQGDARTFIAITPEDHDTLGTLYEKLVSAPVLAILHSMRHLTLDTDEFDKRIRCVLTPEKQGETKRHSFIG